MDSSAVSLPRENILQHIFRTDRQDALNTQSKLIWGKLIEFIEYNR